MTRYRVLTDRGAWLTPQMLEASDAQVRRAVEGQWQWIGRGGQLDEEALSTMLLEAMRTHGDRPVADSDADIACSVRIALDLSRREASDTGLWTYLNATAAWPYVAWRWKSAGTVGARRVAGHLDRSALGRLWWMAELCRAGEPLQNLGAGGLRDRLVRLLRSQDAAVALYERPRLLARPELTLPLLQANDGGTLEEAAFRRFALSSVGHFGVRLTSAMDTDAIRKSVADLVERADLEPP
jgi:hypothetical protein